MRILQVSYRLPPEPGGLERHVQRLAREQVRSGHEVLVARRSGHAPEGTRALRVTPTGAGRIASLKSDVLAFAVDCARALRKAGPLDVVHLHGDHREALAIGPAARRLGIPVVLTVHGSLSAHHRAIMPLAFRHVRGFVTVGKRPAAELAKVGVPATRIHQMSSGLDLARMEPFRESHRFDPGLIVSVGSLEKVKNHALTLDAFRRLRILRPHARLVIAGDGPERRHLERLAGPGVEFTGRLTEDEVYALVSRAHAFVLASRRLPSIGEGIPTAALEALALGTAVILSSDISLDPVVTDRTAYRTFRSGSAPELLAQMAAAIDDDTPRAEVAERGRRAVAGLDWPAVAAAVGGWYERFGIGFR
ncbi:GDP-mannose-dependent alpha-(1-6)-phosphatidylinositol dimannoside mannosyltransferase [Planotetraspora silvatica]|uniref:GDP-mannose-dependent alpha-(1-6)-phosphatidylinositol dimannoside mannosyltransferase n=1 Tax=Planotetraspora silvatica TaxID=234614 RepID=A0A8J3UKD8_9ACTN|nr:glycosyltransferase family 4 protein [Planotetraspora silvatica]GII46105.1 GDP-mannose-dependent alpha-(1-6)-phosphatidylinositol dimannoside mannosyltransferase [Planotetraspora silvatica]